MGAGARKRWPKVVLPAAMPSTPKGTISGSSVSGPKVATIERIGDEPLQVRSRLRLHARGNFFRKQFEQKIGHRIAIRGRRSLVEPGAIVTPPEQRDGRGSRCVRGSELAVRPVAEGPVHGFL